MTFDYETGALVSLAIGAIRHAYALAMRFSILHGNFRTLGLRESYVTGRWKRGGSLLWEVPLTLLFSAVYVLMSWVGVACQAISFAYSLWRRVRAPAQAREIQRKLRNVSLPPRQVAELCVSAIEHALGGHAAPHEKEKAIYRILNGKDDLGLPLLERAADGSLVACAGHQVEEEVLAKRRYNTHTDRDN